MKQDSTLAIILVFMFIAIIRAIGIENIPFPVTIAIIIVCMIVALVIALKYKCGKKEHIYLIVETIIAIILFSIVIVFLIVDKDFPKISKQYKTIFIVLIAVLFLSLLAVSIAKGIYQYNAKHKFKK
ncbi:hypothetical protein [Haloimpatiens massiliensis]|uniref:hypothetical protein n=1 Tax=Haloimpatiens massiliensis TaxID=1658110 RepID=UPI000C81E58C|nr:hypothetical protein [Haloimpatiens massiliensis]